MTFEIDICFFLPTDEFYLVARWKSFFSFLGSRGYKISLELSENVIDNVDHILFKMQEFFQHDDQSEEVFCLDVYGSLEFNLQFCINFEPEQKCIVLSAEATSQFYINEEQGLEAYQAWLALLKEIYLFWRPLFVHQLYEVTHRYQYNISRDSVIAGKIDMLYELAIYPPSLIEKIGRARLLTAPAWIIDVLEEDSILLIPEEHNALPRVHYRSTVAQHLGCVESPPSNE